MSNEQKQFLHLYPLGASFLGAVYTFLAVTIDPADSNYGVIARPQPPHVPTLRAGNGISAAFASAINAYAHNAALAKGVVTALSISINRATVAGLAGATKARGSQLAAAVGYARQEANLMLADIALRKSVLSALGSQLAVAKTNAGALRAVLRKLRQGPLPATLSGLLRSSSLDATDRAGTRSISSLPHSRTGDHQDTRVVISRPYHLPRPNSLTRGRFVTIARGSGSSAPSMIAAGATCESQRARSAPTSSAAASAPSAKPSTHSRRPSCPTADLRRLSSSESAFDLQQHALADQLSEPRRVALELGAALRVGERDPESLNAQLVQEHPETNGVDGRRLDQQVAAALLVGGEP